MIIKSMSRKTVSFRQLLHYINAPLQKGRQAILHNLRSAFDSLPQIEAEFLENARHIRTQPRGGVVLYHEILAIAEADREQVTEELLIDLAREYLCRRAPEAIAYAKAQFNTASPHVHILISGNLLESERKLRLERKQFEQVKREVEAYQIEKYPQLSHSIVYGKRQHKAHDRPHLTNPEAERARRLRKSQQKTPTQKENTRERLKACLTAAQSEEHLIELLQAAQLAPYVRGKTPGVTDTATGRKYRLSTLGLDREGQETVKRLRSLTRERQRARWERSAEIEAVKIMKIQRQWLRLGFREKIAETLQTAPAAGRARDLHAIRQRRREQQRERGLDDGRLPALGRERLLMEGTKNHY